MRVNRKEGSEQVGKRTVQGKEEKKKYAQITNNTWKIKKN